MSVSNTPSSAAPVANASAQHEFSDISAASWPEWNEAEVAAEKWAAKFTFEDVDACTMYMPRSMRHNVVSLRRPAEIGFPDTSPTSSLVASQSILGISSVPHPFNASAVPSSAAAGSGATPHTVAPPSITLSAIMNASEKTVPTPTFSSQNGAPIVIFSSSADTSLAVSGSMFSLVNAYLTSISEFMKEIVRKLQILVTIRTSGVSSVSEIEVLWPWELIYPKMKDGSATVNPAGRYSVRLFWCGAWRRVTVDDKVPVDCDGRPLFPTSALNGEIWLWILTKAILKVCSLSFDERDSYSEYADCNIINLLSGLPAESFLPSPSSRDYVRFLTCLQVVTPSAAGFVPASLIGASVISSSQSSFPNNASSAVANSAVNLVNQGGGGSISGTGAATSSSTSTSGGQTRASNAAFSSMRQSQAAAVAAAATVPHFSGMPTKGLALIIRDDGKTLLTCLRVTELASSTAVKVHRILPTAAATTQATNAGHDGVQESFIANIRELLAASTAVTFVYPVHSTKVNKAITWAFPSAAERMEALPRPLPLICNPFSDKNVELVIVFSSHLHFMTHKMRPRPALILEAFDVNSAPGCGSTICRIATNASQAQAVTLAPGTVARIVVEAPANYSIQVLSREEVIFEDELKYINEKTGFCARETEEQVPAQPASSWGLIFKHTFSLRQETTFAASLVVPDFIADYVTICLIDNDSPSSFRNFQILAILPEFLPTNNSSYTLMAYALCPFARPPIRFRLRVLLKPGSSWPTDKPPDVGLKCWTQDFEETYNPAKKNLLLRNTIKIPNIPENNVSVNLQYFGAHKSLTLEIFENDILLTSIRSRDSITLPCIVLRKTEDAMPPSVSASITNSERSYRTGQGSLSMSPLLNPNGEPSPMAGRKYIIQASFEPGDGYNDRSSLFLNSNQNQSTSSSSNPTQHLSASTGIAGGTSSPAATNQGAGTKLAAAAASIKKKGAGVTSSTQVSGTSGSEKSSATSPGSVGTGVSSGSGNTASGTNAASSLSPGVNTGPGANGAGGANLSQQTFLGPEKSVNFAAGGLAANATGGNPMSSNLGSSVNQGSGTGVTRVEPEPRWTLKLQSSDPAGLLVSRDTEKEERHRKVKERWEAKTPGRSVKAKELREAFLRSAPVPVPPAVVVAPVNGAIDGTEKTILTESEIEQRRERASQLSESFNTVVATSHALWSQQKKEAEENRKMLNDSVDCASSFVRSLKDKDNIRGSEHREKVAREIDEEMTRIMAMLTKEHEISMAAAAATAAAEAAATAAIAAETPQKEKAAGKKKR